MTTITTANVDAFLAANTSDVATGQVKENASPFATLTICQENGMTTGLGADKAIPFGSFYIPGTELVAEEITFRPVKWMYKLVRRGPDAKAIVGETVYFDSFFQDAPDTLGHNKLGRLFGKQTKDLSDAAKEVNKKLGELYMDVFGIVTIAGQDVKVRWRVRGGKLARVAQAFTAAGAYNEKKFKVSTILPKNDPELKAIGKTSSAGNYVNITITQEAGEFPIGEVAEYGMELLTFITEYNKGILVAHKKAANASSTDEDDGQLDQSLAVA